MAGSMMSNQPLTLKTTITTVMGTGATFEIFETGIVLTRASIVFRNKLQLERFVVNIATDGVCTIVLRGLDQSQTKTEVPANKKERTSGAEGYVTVLASDLLDIDNTGDEQALTGNVKFTGNVNVEGILSTSNINITNLSVSGKSKPVPKVADVSARNSLYPSPVDGNMVDVEAVGLQIYRISSGGWVTLDEGTPTPDATEAVKGKAKIATSAEVTAGTDDTTIVTPKKLKEQAPGALYEKDQYIAGETILANDSLFVESLPTFAESTVLQNIGDVTGNTRVAILGFGSGVASNTLRLSLRKFVSPSANLSVRIETVSSGSPTGILVDANATATVTAAHLTTSPLDYLTITTNNNAISVSGSGGTSISNARGYRILAKSNRILSFVTKISLSTATRAILRADNGTILAVASYVGDNATFNYRMEANTYYRIESDNNGSSWSNYQYNSAGYTVVSTDINYMGASQDGVNYAVGETQTINNIVTIEYSDISLAGTITIPKGQQVAIVLSQVGDVVNATNYYAIGYVARDTSTRGYFVYNGSVRNPSPISDGIDVATTIGTLPNFFGNLNNKMGVKITMNQNSYLTSITKNTLTTATTAYLTDSSLVTIATATFVGNVATFSTQLLTSGVTYYLLVDAGGSNYASYLNGSMTYPYAYTRFNVIAGRDGVGDSSSRLLCITDITTQGQKFENGSMNKNNFFYTSSTLFENTVLAKTSASFSYKLPNDYVRLAKQGYSVGQSVTSKYYGLHNYPGLVNDTIYYVANTPGAISAVAGSNPYVLGKTNNTTIFKIEGKNLNKSITVTASPFSYINTTGGPIQVKITGGTVNPIVINGVTTATATGHINTLPAGATMTVTYTVLPTITYSDL